MNTTPGVLCCHLPGVLQHVTLDRADFDLRAREVAALRRWVAAPGTAGRRPDGQPVCTAEYMERVLPHLTAGELRGGSTGGHPLHASSAAAAGGGCSAHREVSWRRQQQQLAPGQTSIALQLAR